MTTPQMHHSPLAALAEFRPSPPEIARLKDRAKFSRLETIRLIEIAKVGHYTSAFSAAELFAALYYDVMTLRPGDPGWADRDRFMMGKGHAACGLFPFGVWLIEHPHWMVTLSAAIAGWFVIYRHKSNVTRLRAGTESVFTFSKSR